MTFDKNQIELLQELSNYTRDTRLNYSEQEACGIGKDFWCSDWWTAEVIDFLILGEKAYQEKDFPEILKDNHNFSIPRTLGDGIIKLNMFENAKKMKDLANVAYVCEVGRGIEVALLSFIKKWDKIVCYDSNNHYGEILKGFFGSLVEFHNKNTDNFWFDKIKENSIIILSHGINQDINKIIATNDFIKGFIRDGKVHKVFNDLNGIEL